MKAVAAALDPRLEARVIGRRPLLGPGWHVRAGSSVRWFAGRLAVVQDDARTVALIAPDGREPARIALGPDVGDDPPRPKPLKLDLEACLVVPEGDGELLVAFGSGSTGNRERVALVRHRPGAPLEAEVVALPGLYAALRACTAFAGSELNVEGAVFLAGPAPGMAQVRLFQRGNGAARGGLAPCDATCDLAWPALREHLAGRAPAPPPERVVRYELGQVAGVRLTFTDAAAAPDGRLLYLAGAEASPDTYRDGEVVGAALGLLEGERARYALLRDEQGRPLRDKTEGVELDRRAPDRALLVVDPDDPARPAELLEVALSGPWA